MPLALRHYTVTPTRVAAILSTSARRAGVRVPRGERSLELGEGKRGTEHLEVHVVRHVSLDRLAKLPNPSFPLYPAFKPARGKPPHRWRQTRRVERACEFPEGTNPLVVAIRRLLFVSVCDRIL